MIDSKIDQSLQPIDDKERPPPHDVAQNVASIEVSAIKEMAMRSARVPGAASLAWGLPSFRTPESIRRAIEARLERDEDIGKYSLPDGLPELREAIASTHQARLGILADPASQVMVTAGNMQGVFTALHSIIDPGDEIIVTDPGFTSHFQQIRLCGGKPVFWSLKESDSWGLDVDALADLITEKTKAILLVSPSNPTGKIFSEGELRQVAEIALSNQLLILVDDPYSPFTYENKKRFFSIASLPELEDNLIYLFTFSKAYAMSGWRIGYMILPSYLKRHVLKVHDSNLICAPRVSQVAALVALTEEPLHPKAFESILQARRALICERLDRVPHVFDYQKPEGAYYVFPRILAEHRDAMEFSLRLLEEAKVAVTPGSGFGPSGAHHVRMAYCVSEETINLAFERIERLFAPALSK